MINLTQPTFPIIGITNDEVLEFLENAEPYRKVSTRVLIDTEFMKSIYFFDAQFIRWALKLSSTSLKNNWLTRILAHTVYDPLHSSEISWTNTGNFTLTELKQKIANCIDKDDDALTQFFDADFLKSEIESCSTFDEIVIVLDKYIFNVREY